MQRNEQHLWAEEVCTCAARQTSRSEDEKLTIRSIKPHPYNPT